jgi:hypothetical protein
LIIQDVIILAQKGRIIYTKILQLLLEREEPNNDWTKEDLQEKEELTQQLGYTLKIKILLDIISSLAPPV